MDFDHHDDAALHERLSRVTGMAPDDEALDLGATIRLDDLVLGGPAEDETLAGTSDTEGAPGPSPAPGPHGYSLEEMIGRGGMGVVYRARQESLDRPVALKTSHRTPGAEEQRQRSFVAEAAVTSRLEHPNIIPVHDLGRGRRGEVFFTMKLLEGRSWDRMIHGDVPMPGRSEDRLEAHLDILIDVANALAFAHRQGFLHRDLKPENVLVGDFGEVILTDWGLAARLQREGDARVPHVSEARRLAGTPSYFPPEMALGEGDRQGPWTDVYGLGGVLYEILFGAPPNRGRTLTETLRCALSGDRPYARANEGSPPPAELVGICRRALDPDPGERFPDAAAFRDALGAFRDHRQSSLLGAAAEAALATARARKMEHREADDQRHEALALYRQALALWPQNETARSGLRSLRREWADAAEARGDLGVAAAQLEALGDPDLVERAARLRGERARRSRQQLANRRLRRALVGLLALTAVGLAAGVWLVSRAREEAIVERDNYERLATLSRAELLIEEAETKLWPTSAIEDATFEDWTRRASDALARRPRLIALRDEIRRRGVLRERPHPDEEKFRRRRAQREYDVGFVDHNLAHLRTLLENLGDDEVEERDRLLGHEEQLVGNRARLISEIEELERPVPPLRSYAYEDPRDEFRAKILDETLRQLERLEELGTDAAGGLSSVAMRRAEAARIRRFAASSRFRERWREALRELENDPRLAGVLREPRRDLFPLRERTPAGFLRFALLGSSPSRCSHDTIDEDFDGIVLVLLPAGFAFVGKYETLEDEAMEALYSDRERTKTRIPLRAFLLGEAEVTAKQFAWVMGFDPCTFVMRTTRPDEDWPVETLNFFEAERFAARLGMVVPTNLRLQYAAREGLARDWPDPSRGPSSLEGLANVSDQSRPSGLLRAPWNDGYARISPVRSFGPTHWGFYGLWGNVAEWTCDWAPPDRRYPDLKNQPLEDLFAYDENPSDGENTFASDDGFRLFWPPRASAPPLPPYHRESLRPMQRNREIGLRLAGEIEIGTPEDD